MPIILPITTLSPSQTYDFSFNVSDIQYWTTISTSTLKSVGKATPTCVVPRVACKCRPQKPFWRVTTSWRDQNSSRRPQSFSPTLYPAIVCSSLPRSRLFHALLISRNTRNMGSCYTLETYWASLSSMIAVPVPPLHKTHARHLEIAPLF